MTEKEKYIRAYSGDLSKKMIENRKSREFSDGGYGRGCWGEGVIPFLKEKKPMSICDVGCGYGSFCNIAADFVEEVYGVDIASVVTGNTIKNEKIVFLDGEAKAIPLEDNKVDWITSFDCLEHCPSEDIYHILSEFKRVAKKGFIVSVSCVVDKRNGVNFHLTVRPEKWWLEQFQSFGKVQKYGAVPLTNNPYFVCFFEES